MDELKLEKLLQMRCEIENLSYNDVLDDTLLRGFSQYHLFFHKFLTDENYEDIQFDEETRTLSLIDNTEKTRTSSEKTMKHWKKTLHQKNSIK
jgi:hypothetical protein